MPDLQMHNAGTWGFATLAIYLPPKSPSDRTPYYHPQKLAGSQQILPRK